MKDCTGKKLYYIRILHGYTQEYVARKIGISTSAYIDLERGRTRKIPMGRVEDILAIYGLTLENFYSFGPDDLLGLIKGENKSKEEESLRQVMCRMDGMQKLLFQLVDKLSTHQVGRRVCKM
ncbi:helix-turn-helix transcriptional regulator [Chitinophaga sp. YIM B06452]|uniref:helix-turn-helix transcriptional regulator n=1 Tax=Chitinophaga sp. YIM B06452 TaxID=3082158 RepID=UPI0031FF32E5